MSAPKFQETGFGWITPRGEVVGCNAWNHIDAITQHAEASEAWAPFLSRLNYVRAQCEALEAAEGRCNGEWHNYEIASDDARWEFAGELYKLGFIRIGRASHKGAIEFSGRPEALASRMPQLNKLLREFNETNELAYDLKLHHSSL